MKTDDKKTALINAGVKVRSNASDETIDELYEEHISSIAVLDSKEDALSLPPEEIAVRVEVSSPAPVADPKPKTKKENKAFDAFLEANQDKMLGDKTPAVVQWARENLSKEEFSARYDGRTIPA
jgi:hypothetical protein